jgi:AraC family transcriptional regulator
VVDYVLQHLDRPLPLGELARMADFSPFHFHRIFQSLMQETLAQFVKRVRLERALKLLVHGPKQSLTEIALECGFSSSSDFSRSFKQRYGSPPSSFDLDAFRDQRRGELDEAMGPESRHRLRHLPAGENPDGFEVTLRKLPARRVAYLRVLDPFKPDVVPEAAAKLVQWAESRDLADGQWLGYMWDDPEIVALPDCRYDVGLEIGDTLTEGEIGSFQFPSMLVAEIELRGSIELEMRALDWIWKTWLPNSGYQPTEQPSFEAWLGRPFAHGFEHFELKLQLPVRRS